MSRVTFTNETRPPVDAECMACEGRGWFGMVNTRSAYCYECSGTGREPIPWREVFPNYESDQLKLELAERKEMQERVYQYGKAQKAKRDRK